MNKKGQVGFLFQVILVVLISGVLLYLFSPYVNTHKTELLEKHNEDYPNSKPLEKMLLYGIMPVLWIGWLLMSLFLLATVVINSRGFI